MFAGDAADVADFAAGAVSSDEATVEQDHRRARSIIRVPDSSAVMVYVALIVGARQRRGTVYFELLKVVVA